MLIRIVEPPQGLQGLVLELSLLQEYRRTIGNSWFQRACRRNKVSNYQAKKYLRTYWLIAGDKFPLTNRVPLFHWNTYEGWRANGFQVQKGEHSFARDVNTGTAVFIEWQTIPNTPWLQSLTEGK